ncbi:transmembrane protein 192-like [Watersipora subatra]|uniref:transmembrane protein 192-like n=1 Tax=Watersipora subatra TaxID=2589382 RepID=UPI00355C14F2
MNVSGTHAELSASPDTTQPYGLDTSDRDHLQEGLSNSSLHLTDGRGLDHPKVAKLGATLASFEILVMLGLVATSFLLPHVVTEKVVQDAVSIGIYILLLYLHCFVWFMIFLFDLIFSFHHRRLKMQGYLRFYRSIKYLQRHPFCVKSLFQSVILALTGHLTSSCKSLVDEECNLWTLKPVQWMQILVSIETAIILVGLILYLSKIYYQNRRRLAPDDAEDQMLTSFQPHSLNSSSGVGYRADNYVDDIIEHQADKIRSLQEQNAVLNRKLYVLSCRQSKQTSPSR